MTASRPEEVLRSMEEHVPFNRFLGIEGESVGHDRAVLRLPMVRKGNRVGHVRIAVTQGPVLVAEGRGVYNIHRRPAA